MIRNIIALTAIGVLAVAAPATAEDTHPCARATQRCDAAIQVPLNWDDPGSERITVPFTWLPHTDQTRPSAGVIAGLDGGPQPVARSDRAFTDALGPVLADHDLLIVERRGFGASSPLRCPDLQIEKPDTVRACANQLGPRAQFFSTDQRVADVDAVRRALGVPSLAVYGDSYGTVDAVAYATRFPAHTSAVVADSPLMSDRSGHLIDTTYQDFLRNALNTVGTPCQASQACRREHPRPAAEIFDLVRTLRAHPDPKISMSTVDILLRTQAVAGRGREAVAAVADYIDGDQVPLHRLAAYINTDRGGRDEFFRTNTAVLTYQCNDDALPYDRDASPDVRARQLADYRDRYPQRPIAAAEVGGNNEDFCLNWPLPRQAPPVPAGAAYPDVPALTLGGTTEPMFGGNVVPLAKRFPHGQSVLVPFGGHAASMSGNPACAAELVRSFLVEPAKPVHATCTAETYRAMGHFPRTSAELPATRVPGLAAAFMTASDLLGQVGPSGLGPGPQLPGLRGGTFTGDANGVLHLTSVRYVDDIAVSGDIRLVNGTAEADLTLDSGPKLHLSWRPFQAQDKTTVTGSTDGHPFTVCPPTTT
ncbi:alpha/beta fold hydrolase [Actinocrispum wychmicini]|uniref:TAP-like protein n=1 Tax=Actinocrispum wychmicini TaxID=1213861 RepID=A0A4R2JK95_9PSEU|nr:alpha/beta fold hydrolase [Actinocrispum wychmicini]TCO59574.1 TAP-like protein [Actinocrispum wychmicini]